MNPPVRPFSKKNPAKPNAHWNAEYSLNNILKYNFQNFLPFQHQVKPVPHHTHPDELDANVPFQVEPDGEEDEEGGVEVRYIGNQLKPTLIGNVLRLQIDRQTHPPAMEQIHDSVTGCLAQHNHWCTDDGDWSIDGFTSFSDFTCPLRLDFIQGWIVMFTRVPQETPGSMTFPPAVMVKPSRTDKKKWSKLIGRDTRNMMSYEDA